jgi:hypothetical protein
MDSHARTRPRQARFRRFSGPLLLLSMNSTLWLIETVSQLRAAR